MKFLYLLLILSIFTVSSATSTTTEDCNNGGSTNPCIDKSKALPLKIIAIISIFITSLLGVMAPLFSRSITILKPEGNIFMIIKCFSSGIILGTGFMHVLPDAFEMFESKCLDDEPWHTFPFAGFVAMLSGLVTLAIDSVTTSLYTGQSAIEPVFDQEKGNYTGYGHGHGHGHGQGYGQGVAVTNKDDGSDDSQLLRYRVIAMVLELGIILHSVVIGVSLGATNDACTIKGLIIALCFHHMFEGIGLGGCILQADFTNTKKIVLSTLFAITTPCAIFMGTMLSNIYKDNSPTALVTVGLLNACSAGMLIYMALVDLLATEFMGSMLQGSIKLQIKCFLAALLGCAGMSLLAKWA